MAEDFPAPLNIYLEKKNQSLQNVWKNDRRPALKPVFALVAVAEGMLSNTWLTQQDLLAFFTTWGPSLPSVWRTERKQEEQHKAFLSVAGILSQLLCSHRNVILISTDKSVLKTKLRGGKLEECIRDIWEEPSE